MTMIERLAIKSGKEVEWLDDKYWVVGDSGRKVGWYLRAIKKLGEGKRLVTREECCKLSDY